MGMSTHVTGFKPPDEKWKQMRVIWDSCKKADVEMPDEVVEFFNYFDPDEAGVEVELENTDCVKEYCEDSREGFEIDLSKVPKDVKIIRFVNSY